MKTSFLRSIAAWVLIVLALALVNFVAGRLCLLLTVGPGYATAVFPPAGIALAAVLLFGYRVWPGVFLGAVALNYLESTSLLTAATTGSLGIATGSTLQALAGAWLIRRAVGFPTSLDDERSIVKFFVLGGPFACLIASTWGMTTLWLSGFPTSGLAYTGLAWWVGDTIGVIIFAPLLLIAFGQPREVWRPRWLSVGLPVAMSFGVVVGLFYYARANAESDTRLHFNRLAGTIHNAVDSKVESYLEALHSIAGLYRSSDQVERAEFRLFVERAFTRQPGIAALGWIPRVPADECQRLEQEARRDALQETDPATRQGLQAYRVKRWHADGRWLPYDDKPDELFPVHYIEPYHGNEAALGIDLASNPIRQAALWDARDSDQPIATAPILPAQEIGQELAILLIVPIRANGQPRATVEQRRENLQGFTSAVVRVRDLIETSCSRSDLAMMELTIRDASVSDPDQQWLYGKPNKDSTEDSNREQQRLRYTRQLEVGSRDWQLTITPSKAFLAASRSQRLWSELALGFLFTVAVVGSSLLVTGRNRQVEMLVEQRTRELQLARFTMDHAADAIFWIDDQGRFFDINRTACESLGYTREELTSMSVWDIDPDYPSDKWGTNRERLLKEGSMVFESRHKTKDGRIYPVEISTGPMKFLGDDYLCAIVRDISERKEVERKLKSEQDFLRKLLDIQERERRTVANEIHDGFVQYAVGAQMQVEALGLDEESDARDGPLSMVIMLLRKAIDEGRNLISDLRPMVIDESGLVPAIEHLLADESKRGLTVTFNHDVHFDRLEPMLESTIFRIVQEALNNVKHHSQVDRAVVQLTQKNGQLVVMVRDHGVGFDHEKVPPDRFGLRGIRERAVLFGGRAKVESSPGNGTLVSVELPVMPGAADVDQ